MFLIRNYVESMKLTLSSARHIGISKHAVLFVGPQLDALLHPPMSSKEKKNNSIEYGTGEEQHTAIVSVFDSLAKELRVLNKGLPLAINTVQAICPAFRYSEVIFTAKFYNVYIRIFSFFKYSDSLLVLGMTLNSSVVVGLSTTLNSCGTIEEMIL